MDQPRRIDVISDAICPWCWIGKRQLEAALGMLAAEGLRFTVHWRPYQLNPDMPREGVERDAYRAAKFGSIDRSRELDAQVAAAGAAAGLGFRHDLMRRTPNTVQAHRLIRWAGPVQNALVEALFQAYFADGQDIGDDAALTAIAASVGLDAAAFLASDAERAEVLAEDAQFRRIGISGVPSFALEGRVMFSGAWPADRMADLFARRVA
ncbi:MAG: DsbA family oxidoreductase [Rubritepida sp.]|jgi:predicted DsbA family dithiol-disulfide isomerase|nr:DsbA family oxidoreductase [Rubritepida sp.]